jgi:hypothetical protein
MLDQLDPESGIVRHVYLPEPRRVLNAVFESADGRCGSDSAMAWGSTIRPRANGGWTAQAARDAALPGDLSAIAQDRAGLLWTWSLDEGVQARSPDGRVVERIALGDGHGLDALLAVSQLRIGPDGRAWIAGSTGLLAWSPAARRFAPVPGIAAGAVDGFGVASDGALWVARTGRVEQYRAMRRDGAACASSAPGGHSGDRFQGADHRPPRRCCGWPASAACCGWTRPRR